MNDYISRGAAIKRIKYNKRWSDDPRTLEYAANLISTLLAADVRPVVRGEWLPITEKMYSKRNGYEDVVIGHKCPACGREINFKEQFCPSCGADMRGESNG